MWCKLLQILDTTEMSLSSHIRRDEHRRWTDCCRPPWCVHTCSSDLGSYNKCHRLACGKDLHSSPAAPQICSLQGTVSGNYGNVRLKATVGHPTDIIVYLLETRWKERESVAFSSLLVTPPTWLTSIATPCCEYPSAALVTYLALQLYRYLAQCARTNND